MIMAYVSKSVHDVFDLVTENVVEYRINTIYKNSQRKSTYWYINTHGFLHIIKPQAVKLNGVVIYYTAKDKLLTRDGLLRDYGENGQFKTKEECIAFLDSGKYFER